jgi:uncharacterized protein
MPYEPPPYLSELDLEQIADLVAKRKLPPVADWAPERVGTSEMRIAADGTWFHQDGPIRREAMVRAFAGLLIRDTAGQHWLMTPFEKLSIEVDDAAFIAVDCVQRDDALVFRLNTDDLVVAGPDHPLRAAGSAETPALYLDVRHGCKARLNRSTYAQLAEIALEQSDEWVVESQGERFSLVPSGAAPA